MVVVVLWRTKVFWCRCLGHLSNLHFPSQVALGLGFAGQLSWLRILFLIPTQLLASMVAGGLVHAMFGGNIANINTILVSGTSIAQGLFIEMFLTAQLVFVVLMLAVEKSKDTFMAPIGIGLALFVAELSGKYFSTGEKDRPPYCFKPYKC